MIKTYSGIVIRQTKTTGGRRMILIFTREEGKISAGTHISEKSKGGAALAIRPFTYGHYTMTEKSAGIRSISSAETLDAHFALGSDAERFTEASFALEITEKVLPEGAGAPEIFDLLNDYLSLLAKRKTDFRLLTVSYLIKMMRELGVFPDPDLLPEFAASGMGGRLISELNDDILNIIVFIAEQPLERIDALTLEAEKEKLVFGLVMALANEYLELGTVKSERMLSQGSVS